MLSPGGESSGSHRVSGSPVGEPRQGSGEDTGMALPPSTGRARRVTRTGLGRPAWFFDRPGGEESPRPCAPLEVARPRPGLGAKSLPSPPSKRSHSSRHRGRSLGVRRRRQAAFFGANAPRCRPATLSLVRAPPWGGGRGSLLSPGRIGLVGPRPCSMLARRAMRKGPPSVEGHNVAPRGLMAQAANPRDRTCGHFLEQR